MNWSLDQFKEWRSRNPGKPVQLLEVAAFVRRKDMETVSQQNGQFVNSKNDLCRLIELQRLRDVQHSSHRLPGLVTQSDRDRRLAICYGPGGVVYVTDY